MQQMFAIQSVIFYIEHLLTIVIMIVNAMMVDFRRNPISFVVGLVFVRDKLLILAATLRLTDIALLNYIVAMLALYLKNVDLPYRLTKIILFQPYFY